MRIRRVVLALPFATCIVLTAWFMAQATFSLREQTLEPLPMPLRKGAPKADEQPAVFDAVGARNLFGVSLAPAMPSDAAPPEDADDVTEDVLDGIPVSKRSWKLQGTIVYATGKLSRAVIMTEGSPRIYRQGERVQGWEISAVRRRAVVLSRGASRERLIMADASLAPAAGGTSAVRKIVSRDALQRQMYDTRALLQQISVTPAAVGGYNGLRINALSADGIADSLGLRQGDMLLEADGRRLTGFEDLTGLADLVDKRSIALSVLRDGKKIVIEYDLRR